MCHVIALFDAEHETNDTHHPEFEEILKDCRCNEHTVHHGVGEEKQEKLVVGKAHTVVNPRRKK